MLDEIFAIEWTGGRWKFKKSFGTALKLWGDSAWGNLSTYGKLAAIIVMILSEPAVMERYGVLSPIVVDNAAIRDRLHLPPSGGASTQAALAQGAPYPTTGWPAIDGAFPTIPTEGAAPPANQPDRTIYDTARRIWQRLAH
jgi:hypothetical protein